MEEKIIALLKERGITDTQIKNLSDNKLVSILKF